MFHESCRELVHEPNGTHCFRVYEVSADILPLISLLVVSVMASAFCGRLLDQGPKIVELHAKIGSRILGELLQVSIS